MNLLLKGMLSACIFFGSFYEFMPVPWQTFNKYWVNNLQALCKLFLPLVSERRKQSSILTSLRFTREGGDRTFFLGSCQFMPSESMVSWNIQLYHGCPWWRTVSLLFKMAESSLIYPAGFFIGKHTHTHTHKRLLKLAYNRLSNK